MSEKWDLRKLAEETPDWRRRHVHDRPAPDTERPAPTMRTAEQTPHPPDCRCECWRRGNDTRLHTECERHDRRARMLDLVLTGCLIAAAVALLADRLAGAW